MNPNNLDQHPAIIQMKQYPDMESTPDEILARAYATHDLYCNVGFREALFETPEEYEALLHEAIYNGYVYDHYTYYMFCLSQPGRPLWHNGW
jgi:hypothetical protein